MFCFDCGILRLSDTGYWCFVLTVAYCVRYMVLVFCFDCGILRLSDTGYKCFVLTGILRLSDTGYKCFVLTVAYCVCQIQGISVLF